MARPIGDYIPYDLKLAAKGAGYGEDINGYCMSLGFADQWVYKFFRRPHMKLLPYKRIADALEISISELLSIIAHADFRACLKEKKFNTIQMFVDKAKVSRHLIEDICARRIDGLVIFTYDRTMKQAKLPLETLTARLAA